jgi:hypothetical protein
MIKIRKERSKILIAVAAIATQLLSGSALASISAY